MTDDFRIRAALPTIEYLGARGARVTACTHLGRPKGAPDTRWELGPVREELARLAPQVELLENLRFDPGETANDPAFVEKLVNSHDAYVNDAFGVSHRRHASVVGPAELPARAPPACCCRRRSSRSASSSASPSGRSWPWSAAPRWPTNWACSRPCCTMWTPWWWAGEWPSRSSPPRGTTSAGSLVDRDRIGECAELLASGTPIHLPTDIVALEPGADFGCDCTEGEVRTVGADVPDGWQGLDIGPETVAAYAEAIAGAGTVLWNGPMGVFEDQRFCAGTAGVAAAVAACPGYTVVGGGDSAAAVDELGLADRISFISTGGGASLELLEFGDLPGLAALRGAPNAPGHTAR